MATTPILPNRSAQGASPWDRHGPCLAGRLGLSGCSGQVSRVFDDLSFVTQSHSVDITFDEAQSLVASLPRQDRARLFVWLAAEIADQLPGIEFDPRICGGSARIAGTRIPVWSLESWRRLGADDLEILRNFPTLKAPDLLNAWSYVARHPHEIDREISENASAA